MKKIQIVFKNHLLPPITTQFYFLKTFLSYQQPQLTAQKIKALCENIKLEPIKQRSFMKQMQKHNKQIAQKNLAILQKYRDYLEKVPFYYELLLQRILKRKNLNYHTKNIQNLFSLLKEATVVQKKQTKQVFEEQYKKYHKKFAKSNPTKIIYIPILYFMNAKELFQAQNPAKNWEQADEMMKVKYQAQYKLQLQNYNNKMNIVCLQASLSNTKLASLIKKQQVGDFYTFFEKHTVALQQIKNQKKEETKLRHQLKKEQIMNERRAAQLKIE